ncbi:MAP9 protein, partial [Brachypteracias leptosomus]|nr:MAP9 protein [Brachypteracias leptosomus]
DKDQKKMRTSDLKLENNISVTEIMSTALYEKTKKLEKSTDETMKLVEGQTGTDKIQKVSVNDQSEQEEAKNTSEDSVKVLFLCDRYYVSWYFYRSLSSAHLKKKTKAAPVSSQYLGTLKVLEDKRVHKNSTEFDKADSLRAAVFQNWLEKKRAFLLESKRIEKEKAEDLRTNTEKDEAVKREEAIASFEAWKKKKGREAKKLSEKKKLEELKKKKAAEQSEEKTEAAQKSCYMMISCSSLSQYRNEKKEEYMKQKKVEKIRERRKQEIQQAKKEEKNKKAMEEYERWLEKKERREQLEKKKLQVVHRDEVPFPWSPPGKVTYSRNY